MYRVSWGSRCQTRCKIAILIEKPLFYIVFGTATPEIRDTFIDFPWKSRFYDVNGISSYKNNAFYASFCYSLSNVSRFFTFLGGNRGMYRVFACFSSAFCRFQKESFVNRWLFDPRPFFDSASRGRVSKNHRFPLNSFWKSTIFDAGSTRRSRGCIFSQDPFKISLNFLKDFKRISWVFRWFCDPRLLRGRADERPGIDRNYRFTKGFLLKTRKKPTKFAPKRDTFE